MKQNHENRLYDKYLELREYIEKLKNVDKSERDAIVLEMKDMIMDYDDNLIAKNVLDYPLPFRRRWYDRDPFYWMVINALKYADDNLLTVILDYLKKHL
jgi:hypothetical protein